MITVPWPGPNAMEPIGDVFSRMVPPDSGDITKMWMIWSTSSSSRIARVWWSRFSPTVVLVQLPDVLRTRSTISGSVEEKPPRDVFTTA